MKTRLFLWAVCALMCVEATAQNAPIYGTASTTNGRPATPAAARALGRPSTPPATSTPATPAVDPRAAQRRGGVGTRVAQSSARPAAAAQTAQAQPARPAATKVAQQVPAYSPTPMNAGSLPGWSGVAINNAATAGVVPEAAPAVDEAPGPVADGGSCGPSGGGASTWVRPRCWEDRAYGYKFRCVWNSTGDMSQHVPYFPHAHGYYYFRPYNVVHVLQQQEMAQRWGGDARNPYDNRLFERIYQEHEGSHLESVPTLPSDPNYWPNGRR